LIGHTESHTYSWTSNKAGRGFIYYPISIEVGWKKIMSHEKEKGGKKQKKKTKTKNNEIGGSFLSHMYARNEI
jgi:hypothetical protein